MNRLAKALLCVVPLGTVSYAQTPKAPAAQSAPEKDKAGSYYHFAMGRLYAEMAAMEGSKSDYVTKAIEHYQEALKADPSANIVFEELTDLYIQTNHLRDAVTQAEEMLKQNPENIDARRMLGRIYVRMMSGDQPGRLDEATLRKALDQFQKVTEKDPKDADSFVMLGRLYRVSNKSPEAEKAFNAALAADPENEDALSGLASLYADLGDTKKAIEKLKVVAEKSPSERTLAALAQQYEELHAYKEAAEVLKKMQEMSPENRKIAPGLARDLMYSDQLDEALAIYEKLSADDPRNPEYPGNIAEIYRAKHDTAKAREYLNKAKLIDPQNLEFRFQEVKLLESEGKTKDAIAGLKTMLDETQRRTYSPGEGRARSTLLEEYGILQRNDEQFAAAEETFRQMIALGGDWGPRATAHLIDTYRQAKDFTTALKEADAAVKKFPDDRMIKIEHATVLADVGRLDEGAAELRSTMKGAKDRETLLTLAQLYEKAKRYPEMTKTLDEAEKLATTDEEKISIYFMRGAMFERVKKFDQSEAEFRKVLAINPEHTGALNYLGYMLADRSVRLDEAFRLIKKAVDQEPENGAFLDSLGWVYFRQGKLDEAESVLVRALDRIGTDPTVHDHLGDVYFKLGKTRDAMTQWQASLNEYRKQPKGESDPEDVAKVGKKLDDARVKLAKEGKK